MSPWHLNDGCFVWFVIGNVIQIDEMLVSSARFCFFYLWPRLVQIISFNAFSRYLTFLKYAWCLFELAAGVHYGIIWITHLVEQVWFKPQGQNIEINVNLNSNDIVCVPSDSLIRFAFIEICLCHTIVEYTCSLLQQSNNKSNLHGITLSF